MLLFTGFSIQLVVYPSIRSAVWVSCFISCSQLADYRVQEEATDDMQSDFEREATLLSEFDHPNIGQLCLMSNNKR